MSDSDDTYEHIFKVVIIGDSGVGKSSMLHRLVKNEFTLDTKSTIGVDFLSKDVVLDDGTPVRMQLWDTAGQERYRGIAKSYYRNTNGCMIVYDITSRASFENVDKWLMEARELSGPDAVLSLIANKADLKHIREVTMQEGEHKAIDAAVDYTEVSAASGESVLHAFMKNVEEVFKRKVVNPHKEEKKPVVNLDFGKDDIPPAGGCAC